MEEEVVKKKQAMEEEMDRHRDLAVTNVAAEECVTSVYDTVTGTIHTDLHETVACCGSVAPHNKKCSKFST